MGEIIQSLKEFVWDIIGYLIPGFFLIIVLNFILEPSIGLQKNNFLIDWEIFGVYAIIVVCYILGFVVYSLTIFKIKIQDVFISWISNSWLLNFSFFKEKIEKYIKPKHSKYWQKSFVQSSTVISAKEFLKNEGYQDVDNMHLNEMRNILMSRNPHMDEKVYTFMFRSSLFDHISTIFLLVVFGLLVQFIMQFFGELKFIKTEFVYKLIYCLFIALMPLLGNCKRMFYSISQRIPFSNLQ